VSKSRSSTWSKSKNNLPIFETSAKENLQVERAFEEIARWALKNEQTSDDVKYDIYMTLFKFIINTIF
jgi:Ras-related protein Rab-7A